MLFIMLFQLSIVLSRGLHPNTVLDSEFQSLAGFPIRVAGFRIPKALIRIPEPKISRILDSKSKNFLDSGFHKQKFPGFRNLLSKISMIMESGLPYTGRIVRFSSRWGSATEMFALVKLKVYINHSLVIGEAFLQGLSTPTLYPFSKISALITIRTDYVVCDLGTDLDKHSADVKAS